MLALIVHCQICCLFVQAFSSLMASLHTTPADFVPGVIKGTAFAQPSAKVPFAKSVGATLRTMLPEATTLL